MGTTLEVTGDCVDCASIKAFASLGQHKIKWLYLTPSA